MKAGQERNQESLNQIFNSRRPIKSNAYTDGYDAYYKGLDKEDNPLKRGLTEQFEDWNRGWEDAEEEYMSKLFHRPIKSEYDSDDSNVTEFYVSCGEYGQGGTVTVTKEEDGKWHGDDGKVFMGYLTPEEIVDWYSKDYGSAWLENSRRPIKSGYKLPHGESKSEYQLRENFQHMIERAYLDSNGKLNKMSIENAFTEAMEDILEKDPDFFNFYNDEE